MAALTSFPSVGPAQPAQRDAMGAASSVLPESLTTVECQELASAHFAPALSRSPWLSAALAKRGRVRKRDALAAWKRYKESVVLREVAADVLKREAELCEARGVSIEATLAQDLPRLREVVKGEIALACESERASLVARANEEATVLREAGEDWYDARRKEAEERARDVVATAAAEAEAIAAEAELAATAARVEADAERRAAAAELRDARKEAERLVAEAARVWEEGKATKAELEARVADLESQVDVRQKLLVDAETTATKAKLAAAAVEQELRDAARDLEARLAEATAAAAAAADERAAARAEAPAPEPEPEPEQSNSPRSEPRTLSSRSGGQPEEPEPDSQQQPEEPGPEPEPEPEPKPEPEPA